MLACCLIVWPPYDEFINIQGIGNGEALKEIWLPNLLFDYVARSRRDAPFGLETFADWGELELKGIKDEILEHVPEMFTKWSTKLQGAGNIVIFVWYETLSNRECDKPNRKILQRIESANFLILITPEINHDFVECLMWFSLKAINYSMKPSHQRTLTKKES